MAPGSTQHIKQPTSPMNKPDTQQLQPYLGQLFSESLQVSHPVQLLHLIREKIHVRGYPSFDQADMLGELGKLQQGTTRLNAAMLQMDNLLKSLS